MVTHKNKKYFNKTKKKGGLGKRSSPEEYDERSISPSPPRKKFSPPTSSQSSSQSSPQSSPHSSQDQYLPPPSGLTQPMEELMDDYSILPVNQQIDIPSDNGNGNDNNSPSEEIGTRRDRNQTPLKTTPRETKKIDTNPTPTFSQSPIIEERKIVTIPIIQESLPPMTGLTPLMKQTIISPNEEVVLIKKNIDDIISMYKEKTEYLDEELLIFKNMLNTEHIYDLYKTNYNNLKLWFNENKYSIPNENHKNMKWYYNFENFENNINKCNSIRNTQSSLFLKNMLFNSCIFKTFLKWINNLKLINYDITNISAHEIIIKKNLDILKEHMTKRINDVPDIIKKTWKKSEAELMKIKNTLFKLRSNTQKYRYLPSTSTSPSTPSTSPPSTSPPSQQFHTGLSQQMSDLYQE